MDIISNREDILKTLIISVQILGQKPSLPVLNNFLMKAKSGTLEITATNLDTTITKKIPVKVVKEGATTIPARLFLNFCQTAKGDQISLTSKEEKVSIKSGNAVADLTTIPASEFPPVVEFEPGEKIELDAKDFVDTINEVGICASLEEGRPALTGILLKTYRNDLTVVATDGYRLGKKTLKQVGNFEALIPARALSDSSKAVVEEEDESVEMATNKEKNQARIKTRNLSIITRLLDGEYPNYDQIIPDSFPAQTSVTTKDLIDAIKLTSILAKDLGSVVRLETSKSSIRVVANTDQVGEARSDITAKTTGDKITTAFNSKFLLDSLSVVKQKTCDIKFSGPTSAALIQGSGNNNLIHIVMPVRTQG